jgi:peroxiredoxin
MNFRTTYILFGTLVLILVLFGYALYKYDADSPDRSNFVLPGVHDKANPFKAEDVDQVVIARNNPQETITFERDADTKHWRITKPRSLRADDSAVSGLINEVFRASKDDKADKPTSLKSWGLDPPSATITIKKGSEREVGLNIGDVSPGTADQVIYVSALDKPKEPAAVSKSKLGSVLKPLNEFRDRSLLPSSANDFLALTVTEGQKAPVSLKKGDDSRWRFVEPKGYGLVDEEGADLAFGPGKPVSGLRPLLNDLASIRVENKDEKKDEKKEDKKDEKDSDFVEDNVQDLSKYNLDAAKADVLRIEVQYGDSKKPAKSVLLVELPKADDKREKVYACLENEKNVVRIPVKNLETVRKLVDKPEELRDRNLARFSDFAKPDAIIVKNASGTLEFFQTGADKKWKLYRGETVEDNIDEASVKALLDLITGKGAVRVFVDDPKKRTELELDKSEISVSVWADGIEPEKKDDKKDEKKDDKKDDKKDEKKDDKKDEKKEEKKSTKPKLKAPDKPTVRLTFGKREDGLVAVERLMAGDSEPSIVKVPDVLLDRVKDGPLAYYDKSLPQFNPGSFFGDENVSKLVLQRGNDTFEISREGGKADAAWKFVKPEALAGRSADATSVKEILTSLNRLRAKRLVADKPSADALDKEYGLKSPSLKAVVTLTKDGKDSEFTYEFGKELEDKSGVFSRQSQRNLVFVADPFVLTALREKELQDLTVFNFDVAKVKQVKMTGWLPVQMLIGNKNPFVLELERKDASAWEAKAPAGFNIDASKVRKFLEDLSKLRAERFVAHNAQPKPEHDLEVGKGEALQIEITLEGEKEPLLLTVGKLDGEKGYFAVSNKMKGEILQVRRDLFDAVKAKPAYFSPSP